MLGNEERKKGLPLAGLPVQTATLLWFHTQLPCKFVTIQGNVRPVPGWGREGEKEMIKLNNQLIDDNWRMTIEKHIREHHVYCFSMLGNEEREDFLMKKQQHSLLIHWNWTDDKTFIHRLLSTAQVNQRTMKFLSHQVNGMKESRQIKDNSKILTAHTHTLTFRFFTNNLISY